MQPLQISVLFRLSLAMSSLPPWGTDRDIPAAPCAASQQSLPSKPYWTSTDPSDYAQPPHFRRDEARVRPVNKIDDIEGAKARRQHPLVVNKVRPGLSVEDIDGAKPSGRGQFHTNRVTDPLMPVYSLPKYEVKPPTPPSPGRPIMNVDDIMGTHSKPLYVGRVRDNIDRSDVEGSVPAWRRNKDLSKEGRDYMNVSDITKKPRKSNRVTNPLDPKYDIDDNCTGTTLPKLFPPSRAGSSRKSTSSTRSSTRTSTLPSINAMESEAF